MFDCFRLFWGGAFMLSLALPLQAHRMAGLLQEDAPADPELYNLDTKQELVVGSAYRWAARFVQQSTLTWGEGNDVEVDYNNIVECGLIASVLVLDQDTDGETRAMKIVISRLYLFEDELLEEGSVVVAERTEHGETTYTLDGQAIDDEQIVFVLDEFVDVASATGRSDEEFKEMLNVPEGPQAVGAQWDVDAPSLFGDIFGPGLDLDETETAGTVHFVRTLEVFDVAALEVRLQLELSGGLSFFSQAEQDWELLANEMEYDLLFRGPQQDGDVNDLFYVRHRLAQTWHDVEQDRIGELIIVTSTNEARRTLTRREREVLGFDDVQHP